VCNTGGPSRTEMKNMCCLLVPLFVTLPRRSASWYLFVDARHPPGIHKVIKEVIAEDADFVKKLLCLSPEQNARLLLSDRLKC